MYTYQVVICKDTSDGRLVVSAYYEVVNNRKWLNFWNIPEPFWHRDMARTLS